MRPNIMIMIIAFISIPVISSAMCFEKCSEGRAAEGTDIRSHVFDYRDKSHNTGDVKNSVMGDVNIHVGHKRMDVKIDNGSVNNQVNASVSSTIILGDMKQ